MFLTARIKRRMHRRFILARFIRRVIATRASFPHVRRVCVLHAVASSQRMNRCTNNPAMSLRRKSSGLFVRQRA
jgi:hypothetical protein